MTNEAGGIPDFLQRKPEAAPPAETTKPARQPRQRRQAKVTAAEPAPEPAKTKKPRKAKKEPKERAAPETVKVTLKQYASMVVGVEAGTFIKVHGLLAALGKNARAKVITELQKVLG